MKNRLFFALVLSGICFTQAAAQGPLDLDGLDNKLSHHLKLKMPGWKHKRGQPITGSVNVLEGTWSFPNRKIKVSIVPYDSPAEARAAMREGVKYQRENESLKNLGDEAYAWGYRLSNVVFTSGRFSVYVSAGANVYEDPDARTLSEVELRSREYSEIRRLSREFAKHLADAMDLP